MRILVSNDDGYRSAGIEALAEAMRHFGEVVIVAPTVNRSGASSSLTLDRGLAVTELKKGWYAVDGTPTDCVHVAVTALMPERPDLVVSGINDGANMGDDTLYSGTVAAATEGFLFGIPSFAFSLVKEQGGHFAAAAQVAQRLVERWLASPMASPCLLNVNIPDRPIGQIAGHQVTRLGRRHESEPVRKEVADDGTVRFRIGGAGKAREAGEGTDFHAVADGHVSITALNVDLTHHALQDGIRHWLAS